MVTFETKVWEQDWKYILLGDYLDKMISNCNYHFDEKILFINNVKEVKDVVKYAQKKISDGVIDKFYIVDEYADKALEYFGIDKKSFNGGYHYSISELVSIYLCRTDYLLHFSSDSFMIKSTQNWIFDAIEVFKKREDIIVANPTWNFRYDEVKKESFFQLDKFYGGYGFSDQCYLVKIELFKKQIYNEKNSLSERYPKYGGELFEKRVDSFMRNNAFFRITSKDVSYVHLNFPKKTIFYRFNFIVKYFANKRF